MPSIGLHARQLHTVTVAPHPSRLINEDLTPTTIIATSVTVAVVSLPRVSLDERRWCEHGERGSVLVDVTRRQEGSVSQLNDGSEQVPQVESSRLEREHRRGTRLPYRNIRCHQ